jgi:phage baseplate assembly protein W
MAISRALSIEDANLGSSTIVTSRSRTYRDIDLTFYNKPNTGDIYKKTDAAAVKQALINLMLSNAYEKPFDPDFGADLRSLLFELADDGIDEEIEKKIKRTAYIYEPRAEILKVQVNVDPDHNTANITTTFKVVNSIEVYSFTTVVSRLR